jgi:hypothetical protein
LFYDTLTAELDIHPEDSVSTKTARRDLHKSNIHIRAATAIPLITESNVQLVNDGVKFTKFGHPATGKARVIWSDESEALS